MSERKQPRDASGKARIATLSSPMGDAVLYRDGTWKSDDELLETLLNTDFDPRRSKGLDAVMPFGRMAASRAAAQLKGKVVFAEELEPLGDDLIS